MEFFSMLVFFCQIFAKKYPKFIKLAKIDQILADFHKILRFFAKIWPKNTNFSNFGVIKLVLHKYQFSDILKHFWPFQDIFCDFLTLIWPIQTHIFLLGDILYVPIGNIRRVIFSRITVFTGWLTTRFERNFKTYTIYDF